VSKAPHESPAGRLQQLLRSPGCVAAPGAFDPYTANAIAQLGFAAVYLGGNAIGLQLCAGQPFVTMTETADAVRRVVRAVDVPVLVDAGAGFGDPAHTQVTTRELERAGAAGLHLDDQIYPKRAHYHRGRGRLLDAASVVDKLRSVVAARRDPCFQVIARTDALRVTRSIRETIERLTQYATAGIDAAMVLDLGLDQAALVRHALPDLPLVWIGGIAEPVPGIDQLQAAGFTMAVYPFNTVAAITESVLATWDHFAATGRPRQPATPTAQTVQRALGLVGMEAYWDIESRTTERDNPDTAST